MTFTRRLLHEVKHHYLVWVWLFLACQANAQGNKVDSTGMVTLRIDPQSARGTAVSQIFSEVKFIPLETTKESLFGTINNLKIIKDKFLIFDYDTRSVLIFNTDGKFMAKIDASRIPKEEGDKSKPEFYGYQTVEENNNTLIVIYSSKHFFYFGMDGKLVKKVPQKDANLKADYVFADKQTSVRPGFVKKTGNDSTYYEFAIIRKGRDTLAYFPFSIKRYQTDDFIGGSHFFDYDAGNEMFFINYYDYNLYKIRPDRLSLAYRLIFPANFSLPPDFTSNPVYVKKRLEYFQKNGKVFYGLRNAYQVGDNLFLQMGSWGYDKEMKKSIIYNLKTSEITSLQDLEPDSLSSFLPVTDAGAFYDFANHGFHLYQDGYFYASYSSLAMFQFKTQLGDKYKKFTPELQSYFDRQDKKANPIIIQLKPKKQ